ncbi:PspA/IM30 family protein [Paenibacillus sp. NPDC055715]
MQENEEIGKIAAAHSKTITQTILRWHIQLGAIPIPKRALDECRAEIKKLQNYAMKAVEAGSDEDARKFLERKATQVEKREQFETAYDLASSNAASMKQMQDKLVSDMDQLEARRIKLKGKMAVAKVQQSLNAMGDKDFVVEAMEEKVNRVYDEAMAIAELRAGTQDDLDDLFAQVEKSTNAEDELAAIKEKMKDQK